jgi:hypothetical protein
VDATQTIDFGPHDSLHSVSVFATSGSGTVREVLHLRPEVLAGRGGVQLVSGDSYPMDGCDLELRFLVYNNIEGLLKFAIKRC